MLAQRGQRTSTSQSGEKFPRKRGFGPLGVNETELSCRLPVKPGQVGTPKVAGKFGELAGGILKISVLRKVVYPYKIVEVPYNEM